MPLHILGPMVVIGVLAIAVLLHLLGLSQRLRFDAGSARQAWLRHFPDAAIQDVFVAPDGHAALILSSDGPGVVFAMGADSAAKFLRGAELQPDHKDLHIRYSDIGTPVISIPMPSLQQDRWIKAMGPL